MEEFKKKGCNIQMLTTDLLSEEYSQMLRKHQAYLYENISKVIERHIRGLGKTQIESLIDRYLLTDLKYRGKLTISKLEENLETAIVETIDNDQNQAQGQLLGNYLEKIKVILRRNQMDWLYGIMNQFSKQLRHTIDLHFATFKGISDNNFSQNVTNIDKEITKILEQYQDKFDQDYRILLTNFLNNNKRQVQLLLEKVELNNKKTANAQMYSAIVELSNYQLIEENEHLYVQDETTKEKIELMLDGNLLSSQDNKLRYYIDKQKQRVGYYNDETKVSILVHNGLITLIPPTTEETEKNIISFAKNGHNYQLYHNLKPTTDLEKVKSMIDEIAKYAQGIYRKLISDPDFQKLLSQIDIYEKESYLTNKPAASAGQEDGENLSPNSKKTM